MVGVLERAVAVRADFERQLGGTGAVGAKKGITANSPGASAACTSLAQQLSPCPSHERIACDAENAADYN